MKFKTEEEIEKSRLNPEHYCQCGKWIGHRGFCSKKCHNKYYDELEKVKE